MTLNRLDHCNARVCEGAASKILTLHRVDVAKKASGFQTVYSLSTFLRGYEIKHSPSQAREMSSACACEK